MFNANVAVVINPTNGDASNVDTAQSVDVLNGGSGIDTLNLTSKGGTVALPSLTSVEVINAQSLGALTINTTTVAGLTNLNVVKAVGAIAATAAATTDIKVDVAQATAVGNLAANAPDVKADIAVKGGKDVTVNVTGVKQVLDVDTGNAELNGIVVGGATTAAAAGTVAVTTTGAASVAATDATLSSITVTGGKTISVTQKATSDAAAAAADVNGATITQGAVTITGNAATTAVTVKQDASVAEAVAVVAVAAKAATQDVTFVAMTKGQTVTVDFGTGTLTFTANKALTAAEAASAFANLTAVDAKQGNASASLGIYTDVDGGVTNGWTSGAVTTVSATEAKVAFTSAKAATAITNGNGNVAAVAGAYSGNAVAAVAAKAGVLGVVNGAVGVTDANATIKTISVDGYGASSTTTTSVLETLNLSNSGLGYTGVKVSSAAVITVADTAATLALNLENVGFSGYYNGDTAITTVAAGVTLTAAPTTLNVQSTGNNYVALAETTADITTLNVSGTGLLNATTTNLAKLETVKVTGTAGLTLGSGMEDTIKTVDTTGTTGTVSVTIGGTLATYTGGAGVDNVSVTNASTAISNAIDLGAGNDRLDLSATLAINPTVEIKGGDGVDTLVLSAAAAVARTSGVTFQDKISSFEKLEIGSVGVASTVDLSKMDAINYVISTGAGGTAEVQTIALGTLENSAAYTLTLPGSIPLTTDTSDSSTTALDLLTLITSNAGYATLPVTAALSGTNLVLTYKANAAVTGLAALTATGYTTANATETVAGVTVAAAVLTFDKMLTDATVEMKALGNVEVKLATDGLTDVVNVVANAATGIDLGTLTAAKVETINITAYDTDTTTTATGVANVSTNSLTLAADKAVSVNLTGAGNLTLTLDEVSTAVTMIDGSTATGKLNVTTLASDLAATTVKGGSAVDTLVAQGANDVLIGGAGNDILKVVGNAASAVTLTGGEGVDSFDVSGFLAANAGAAATITDFTKGETIKFATDADANFASSKVVLIAEATFDNYVTEAAKAADLASAGDHGIAWFQFGGNTFIVQDVNGDAAFGAGTDIIVKITGAVDLAASSFNEAGQGTLLYI